jgi:hypothetical protein
MCNDTILSVFGSHHLRLDNGSNTICNDLRKSVRHMRCQEWGDPTTVVRGDTGSQEEVIMLSYITWV